MIEKQIGFPYRMVVCRTAKQQSSMAAWQGMAAWQQQQRRTSEGEQQHFSSSQLQFNFSLFSPVSSLVRKTRLLNDDESIGKRNFLHFSDVWLFFCFER
jgi:hypothetical protein